MARKLWIGTLWTIGLVCVCSSRASAFAFDMVARTATTGLDVSDTVTVDVFFDGTDIDVYLFDVRVLSSNASAIHYDPAASAALPASGSAGPGTQPAYILYDPPVGTGMSTLPAVALYPFQTPVWPTWPTPPPGEEEVQIAFLVPNLTSPYSTRTTGTGLWIASLVFHVDSPIASESLALSVESLQVGLNPYPVGQIGVSSAIPPTGVPEPTTGLLMGLALVAGLAVTGRRRGRAGTGCAGRSAPPPRSPAPDRPRSRWTPTPPRVTPLRVAAGREGFALDLGLWLRTLLVAGAVGLWSSQAAAFAFDMVARTPTTGLGVGDAVVVDVFFDATAVDVYAFSLGVLSSNASAIHYDPVASAALPAAGGAGPGAQPAYILYAPPSGMSLPSTALYPDPTPVWATWPTPPAGAEQVNVYFHIPNLTSTYTTRTTGSGIWIASLVFQIDSPITAETLALSMTAGGNVFYTGYQNIVAPQQIGLGSPIVLTGVPEPTTGLLMGLALVVLAGRAPRRVQGGRGGRGFGGHVRPVRP